MHARLVGTVARNRPTLAIAAVVLAAGTTLGGSAPAQREPAEAPEDDPQHEVRLVVVDDGGKVVRVGSSEDSRHKGAFLGVSLGEDTDNPEGGAKVESVVEDSPASEAGIERGDTIVAFGDSVIRGPGKLSEKIHTSEPGERVTVKLIRKNGKKDSVTVEMGERPKPRAYWYGFGDDEGVTPAPLPELESLGENWKELGKGLRLRSFGFPPGLMGSDRPRLGVELVETTAELREYFGADREAGVLIGKVLAGTPAERAGLRVGDVIVSIDGKTIQGAGDLIEELGDKEGKTIDLELVRDRRPVRVSVAIPKLDDESDTPTGPRATRRKLSEQEFSELERSLHEVQSAIRAAIDADLSRVKEIDASKLQRELRMAAREGERARRDALREARKALMRTRNAI